MLRTEESGEEGKGESLESERTGTEEVSSTGTGEGVSEIRILPRHRPARRLEKPEERTKSIYN